MLGPPCSFRQGRCILCLPLQVTADSEAAVAASPEESSFRSSEKASCFFEGAACKGVWGQKASLQPEEFLLQRSQSYPSLLFWTSALAQNKMGSDCVFLKSCSWTWWPLLKPCQRDVFILFLFFWNPFNLSHLLQDLTPQPEHHAQCLSGCLHS